MYKGKCEQEHCERITELFSQGMSTYEIAAEFGVARETLRNWRKINPDFAEAYERGLTLYRAYWERQGRTNLKERDFNATLWYKNMINRFQWQDRQENSHSGEVLHKIEVEIVDPENEGAEGL